MALVGVAEDQSEAEVWQSALRAVRIPSLVKNRNPLGYLQADVPFSSYNYEVWVPRSALRRARTVLSPSLKPHQGRRAKPLTRAFAVVWLLNGPLWYAVGAMAVTGAILVGVVAVILDAIS